MKNTWINNFSISRLWAMIIKEFIQIRRDRPTIIMMLAIPFIQLILFGFAINTNPKNLPTALVAADNSNYTRLFLQAMKNSEYFRFVSPIKNLKEAEILMQQNKIQFIIFIPENFTRNLIRGKKPQILAEVDATDPVSSGNAVSALTTLINTVFNPLLIGSLTPLRATAPPVELITHLKYNPLIITQYNIIPGLLGVVLTMSMAFVTALSMTRERERGTMENLLATPARPVEIILGKIIPYVLIGYVQSILILLAARFIFNVPIEGSISLLLLACLPFIAANLSMGLTFSTLAKNQLQAINGAMFFFLPSILLSGFMFPFRGMPEWAQYIGEILPLTHFVRIVRGILLKGNGFFEIWPDVWPIVMFAIVAILIGIVRFRRTLD